MVNAEPVVETDLGHAVIVRVTAGRDVLGDDDVIAFQRGFEVKG